MEIPEVLADKYQMVREIGAGGFGVVYEARHLGLDRRVAMKLMRGDDMNMDPEFRERFAREARVMSRLEHPNAVRVYDYGEHGNMLYIAMEFLEGHPLEDELPPDGMEIRRALEIIEQMCDVLTLTHSMGLVHRDIKPDNIFITDTDHGVHATLVDFGLAFIAGDQDLSRMTREGVLAGTPQFLSPEQAQASRDIGPPSDIYSLGCVLYELLCGQPAVTGKTVLEFLNQHVFVPATSLRVRAPDAGISPALDNFTLSMLHKDPAGRPTAFEAATFLRKMLASDDMRGRGRPAGLLQPRAVRALTANHLTDQGGAFRQTLPVTPTGTHPVLGVLGEVSAELTVAASVAGWEVRAYAPGAALDVLVVMDPAALTSALTAAYPTVAVVGSTSIPRGVELLHLGADDLVDRADPNEILRKARRLHAVIQRRGRR